MSVHVEVVDLVVDLLQLERSEVLLPEIQFHSNLVHFLGHNQHGFGEDMLFCRFKRVLICAFPTFTS